MKQIAAMPPMPTPAGIFDLYQRYEGLGILCDQRQHGFSRRFTNRGWENNWEWIGIHFVPLNFNKSLRIANEFCDQFRDAFGLSTYAERKARLTGIDLRKDRMADASKWETFVSPENLIWIVLPYAGHINEIYTENLTQRDLTLTALTLRLAWLEKGAYPDDSVASFLVPTDRFTGKLLLYRKEGGGYVLYSAGRNLKDDGGKDQEDDDPNTGDIVVRIER
jgi:hypothetical protein